MRLGTDGSAYLAAANAPNGPGQSGAPIVLKNIGAGQLASNSVDAINGSQVYALVSNIAQVMGGGATFNAGTGTLTPPSYAVQGRTYNNVGSALGAIDSSITNLNTNVNALNGQVSNLYTVANQLNADIQKVRREERGGIAAVAAMPYASMPSAPGRTSWSGNVSRFKDQTGMGFAFAHRLDVNSIMAVTGGIGWAPSSRNVVGRIGLAGEF